MNTMNEMTIREMAAINSGGIVVETIRKAPEMIEKAPSKLKELGRLAGEAGTYVGKTLLGKICYELSRL